MGFYINGKSKMSVLIFFIKESGKSGPVGQVATQAIKGPISNCEHWRYVVRFVVGYILWDVCCVRDLLSGRYCVGWCMWGNAGIEDVVGGVCMFVGYSCWLGGVMLWDICCT